MERGRFSYSEVQAMDDAEMNTFLDLLLPPDDSPKAVTYQIEVDD